MAHDSINIYNKWICYMSDVYMRDFHKQDLSEAQN